MKQELEAKIAAAVQELFGVAADVELTRPEEQFGDYATNIALQLAKPIGRNPREIGEALAEKLRFQLAGQVSDVSVAGPGFLNLALSQKALLRGAKDKPGVPLKGKEILVEFGDPNPFKEMHIGHLYSYVVGDAIASLLGAAGASVRRLSYHGDVGLHVAKAIWGMQQADFDSSSMSDSITTQNIGAYYAKGAAAYEADSAAKQHIDAINKQVYEQHPEIQALYNAGKRHSFANFAVILGELNIKNTQQYLESAAAPIGIKMVQQNVGNVFKESDGAIVYEGEKAGLHTRVFITSKGLPTYETKDLGLTELKARDYPKAARSIIITAHEQAEYFKVMLAALAEIDPELAGKTTHLSHGFVSLSTGKMSSRTGNVYSAANLFEDVKQAVGKLYSGANKDIRIGAIKYEFLKHRLGSDLAYDVGASVSLEGNSGPYLQYAHARACSILAKTDDKGAASEDLQGGERTLVRKLSEYAEVVDRAVSELMPHHVANYLYELAQAFNRFYEKNRVIGDEREGIRLALVKQYADTLKQGLALLGIAAPDKI